MKRPCLDPVHPVLSLPFFAAARKRPPLKLAATMPLTGLKDGDFRPLPQALTATAYFDRWKRTDKLEDQRHKNQSTSPQQCKR